MLSAVLGAFVLLIGCAPAANSTGRFAAPKVELEVRVATNCEAGIAVVVQSDGKYFLFPDPELTRSEDPSLPFFTTMVVPGRRGAPYHVQMSHACDGVRRMEVSTFRLEGEARAILSTTTAMTQTGLAESSGGM